MAAARMFLLVCLSLLLIQSFGRENFVRVSSENHGGDEHPEWLVFWHQHPHPPLPSWIPKTKFPHPPLPSWLPKTKFPHPPLPSWLPKTKFPHPPLPSWLPKTKFPHPPLPSWLPKTKFPHPPLPSWLPKTKWPTFPHPPLPSWHPKNKWHFPAFPPLPSGGSKWPWLPHGPHHSTKCPSTPAVIESCMKEGFSFSDTNAGYKFSTECCKSVAEIKDECSDEFYVPMIKYQCRFTHA